MGLESKIFEKHYEYYKSIGVETIKQQAGQVEQVSSDYQGRVIFELLQNAFDRADEKILVKVIGNSLFIANDGEKFTYTVDYDYMEGRTDRADFQSLCSISTSTKTDSKSIGNKGVGFKSVFSVAKDGFVNVYTKGHIIKEKDKIDETISFSIFDTFRNINEIPETFNEDVKENIKQKIELVQKERKERGVPGYYFPVHITEEPVEIEEFFKNGFVTIIEIPFNDIEDIKPLFKEIESKHFEFISLKYPNKFSIKFELNGNSFNKQIGNNSTNIFSASVNTEKLKNLAKKAEIPFEETKVALCIKNTPDGLMYNYLPTKEKSPFKYIDFHADFHTTVDRKSIEFDNKSAIGRYNSALLKACTELYFMVLNSYIPIEHRVILQLDFIDNDENINKLNNFDWNIIILNNGYEIFRFVRSVLGIYNYSQDNYRYKEAANILTEIALEYLKEVRGKEDYNLFFKTTLDFIIYFSRDDGQRNYWVDLFKNEFAEQIISKKIQVLPDVVIGSNKEVLFKDNKDDTVKLPAFLGINITNFKISDSYFQKQLGINNYSDINVLFKYYRQIGIKGEISTEELSEQKQIELLSSLFELFRTKKEAVETFTYRYKNFFNEHNRKNYSAQNITAFSVSTVFLKTKQKRYKPAQLCSINDLDDDFIKSISQKEDFDNFLKFIGVSTEKNYTVIDKTIYDKFKDGIEYIPMVYSQDETSNLTAKEIIPNIRVVHNDKLFNPALINYNRYSFLHDISNINLRKQLNYLRIGEYNSNEFPKEYVPMILSVLKDNVVKYPADVNRFYSANVFHLLAKINEYLIINNGYLSWTTETDFFIAKNRVDYALLKKQNINLLCFYNGKEVPDKIKDKIIELDLKDVIINNSCDKTDEFKLNYKNFIPYILAEKSYLNTSISEKDYIKNVDDVIEFQDKWYKLKIIEGDNLKALLTFNNNTENIETKQDYLFKDNTLYLCNSLSNNKKAQAIAKYIFDIGNLDAKIELIFFHKEIKDLKTEYNSEDIRLINSKLRPDYQEKYEQFQKEILSSFDQELINNELWYRYNKMQKSSFLISLSRDNKLNNLKQIITETKSKYEGYFDNFQLEIDITHIEHKVSKLIVLLGEIEQNKEYIEELNQLSKELGSEEEISKIENEIYNKYPGLKDCTIKNVEVTEKEKEIKLKNRIDAIYNKIKPKKTINNIDLTGNSEVKEIPVKRKKVIYKGKEQSSQNLEIIGATGEEEVLIYFIDEFLRIKEKEKRIEAINKVYILLKNKIGDDSHKAYRDKCLKDIENDEDLRKALIPFFYVTMHHKFSYFDLIAYFNGEATLVEVKTSSNKNKKFYISISEVSIARSDDNYIIVRNLPDSIDILGNPIKDIEEKIFYVKGAKFSLKPRNYEFIVERS